MGTQNSQPASQKATSRGRRSEAQRKEKQNSVSRSMHHSSNITLRDTSFTVPSKVQQAILDVFTQAFPIQKRADFRTLVQEVKGHLYNRDFDQAFSKQEYLDVYASRWSAARALAYADVFAQPNRLEWFQPLSMSTSSVQVDRNSLRVATRVANPPTPEPLLNRQFGREEAPSTLSSIELCIESFLESSQQLEPSAENSGKTKSVSNPRVKVVCIGGGAGAEVVALAASHRNYCCDSDDAVNRSTTSTSSLSRTRGYNLDILAIDIADWSEPLRKLTSAVTALSPCSDVESQPGHGANLALSGTDRDGLVNICFKQQDVLQLSTDAMREILHDVTMVTIMFTLNELFTSNRSRTTIWLLELTDAMPKDAYLLVVDSPGSYSEVQLGKSDQTEKSSATRNYPMRWLMDHALLRMAGEGNESKWTKIEEESSKWFRIDDKLGLKYGVDLENCRYQIHAYRKLK